MGNQARYDFRHCSLTTCVVKLRAHSLEENAMPTSCWLSCALALVIGIAGPTHATPRADALATIERNARASHTDAVLVMHDRDTQIGRAHV